MAQNDTEKREVERGPNGIPYIDPEGSQISAWESGEFCLRVLRTDGEILNVNLAPDQVEALQEGLAQTRTEAAEKPEIDYEN